VKKILGAGDKEFWRKAARAWEGWEASILQGLSATDAPMFRALELEPGMRVLDLACGSGDPALAIARWLAPGGQVVGVDNSPAMLALARRRARVMRLRNVRFQRGDLAKLALREKFDRVVSRYGLMFTSDLPETLRSVQRALKPGGRVVFVVWGPLKGNAGNAIRREMGIRYGDPSPPDPETVPHPLRFARPGLLPRLLRRAGFTGVTALEVRGENVFRDVEECVQFQMAMPLSGLVESLAPAKRRRLRADLVRAFDEYRVGEAVRVPNLSWLVAARRGRATKRG
jgi:SAM-dependent methyltransferase